MDTTPLQFLGLQSGWNENCEFFTLKTLSTMTPSKAAYLLKRLEESKKKVAEIESKYNEVLEAVERKKSRPPSKVMTKRKILLGSYILHRMETMSPDEAKKIMAGLDEFLTRPGDRAAWGLDTPAAEDEKGRCEQTHQTV